jgi:hypothetical protein
MTRPRQAGYLAVALLALAASSANALQTQKPAEKPAKAAAAKPAPVAAKVFLTPTCGCCGKWADHMQAAGFAVERVVTTELEKVEPRQKVPANLRSCHTAVIGKYIVEGHVPADVVQKLLKEGPAVVGLSAPNMPVGSPGMEGPNAKPYPIIAFKADGSVYEYARAEPNRR